MQGVTAPHGTCRRSDGLAVLVAVALIGLTACGGPGPRAYRAGADRADPAANSRSLHSGGTARRQSQNQSQNQSQGAAIDPAYFSPGACVAFPPTTGDRHLDMSGRVLTVTGVHDDVAARDVCANKAHADVLIGVYFNSGATAANAGCLTAYDTAGPFAADNRRLADDVQSSVLAAMNAQGWKIPDDRAQPDQGLGSTLTSADHAYGHLLLLGPAKQGYFGTPSAMPGALVEPLFITDPFEGSIAASSHGQQVIAAGLATAVEKYFAPRLRHNTQTVRSKHSGLVGTRVTCYVSVQPRTK